MDGSALRATLQESRERLFASLRGLGEEQFRHMAAGSDWNIATHLAHLLRTERTYIDHARRAGVGGGSALPDPSGANADDGALAQRLAVPQIIHGMQAARRELELLIDAGGAEIPVADTVTSIAAHEGAHAAIIAELARSAPQSPPVIPLTPRA